MGSHTLEEIPAFTRTVLERIALHIGSYIIQAKNEEKIRQYQQDIETAFNTIDDFLFILDMDGNMIHFNSTVHNRLGYKEAELLNKHVLKVHPPDRHEEAGQKVQGMLMGTEKSAGCLSSQKTEQGSLSKQLLNKGNGEGKML
jgi:PAS domain S-box-containing protein